VELGETTRDVMRRVDELQPKRVIFDSLSEMRLLAQNPLRYRRQILALKQFFTMRRCTVLMLDDRTSDPTDLQLHSIAHGVISLEQVPRDFGAERRRLRIVKMRGISYLGGYHDFGLDTGGITVFPRLVAARHHADFVTSLLSSGTAGLDAMLGGGLNTGTNTLLSGPSGVGKTTTAMSCVAAAMREGRKAAYFLFDEGIGTFLARSRALGLRLDDHLAAGQLLLVQVDPAELSPGEFSAKVQDMVEADGASVVVIDSLNAYIKAMPGDHFLLLQMHELLSYLNQKGVTTILILGQHGLVGDIRSDIDLSYLSDAIVLFRFFEAHGELRTAVSVIKSRTSAHERSIREFYLSSKGLHVGEALRDFEGLLSGLPSYRGVVLNRSAIDAGESVDGAGGEPSIPGAE
jgi:circadian clock protein KaiC